MVVSSEETAPVSMGGVGTEESAWGSTVGELAPRGERTVTLGRRFGVFFIACRAVVVESKYIQLSNAFGIIQKVAAAAHK